MSQYTKSTNFATKDNLSPGDPLKIVRGTEIDTEFNNISTAISTKTDNSAAAITGGSISGITDLAIADGGTGASTATAALNNLLPSQTGNSSKYLQTDGTNATWDAISINTGDITGTLPVANGGTGITSFGTGIATFLGTPSSANLASAVTDETGSGALVFANTPTLVSPILGTPTSGNFSSGSFTWPTFNQNTTGTAAGLSATLAIASGGTGQTTANAAFNALAPSQTSASGKYLKSDGTNTSWDALDISTADITGTLPVANGGTGITSFGTGIATFLETPSSANLRSALTDETGTGSAVFATSPTLVTPILGTPQSGNFSTGTFTWPTFNQNTTGTAAGLSATLATTSGGTGLTSFTSGGVVYASSTSALATGSGLTFDGTKFTQTASTTAAGGLAEFKNSSSASQTGNIVATNDASTAVSMRVFGSAAGTYGMLTAGSPMLYTTASNLNLVADNASGVIKFGLSSAVEGMRLTSTGLGIGTSSPTDKLQVTAGGLSTIFTGNNINFTRAGAAYITATGAGSSLLFGTANTTGRLTLDASGNLGLGVTPSAWRSGAKAFQLGTTGYASLNEQANGSTSLNFNCYESAANTWTYLVTGFAPTRYTQLSGAHSWFTAATGTAGNAITFTQAMTLDASGNLGVGTTSPQAKLQVLTTLKVSSADQSSGNVILGDGSSTAFNVGIGRWNGSTNAAGAGGVGYFSQGVSNSGGHYFYTGDAAAGSQTERARITSGGNLLVGTNSSLSSFADGRIEAAAAASSYGLVLDATASSASGIGIRGNDSTTALSFFNAQSGATVGSIVINSATTSYNVTSDQRLKENIQDADSASSLIDSLQVRKFDWKVNGLHQPYGFIAQELVTVSPEAVYQPADTEEMMAVDYSKLVPMLVKEIQSLRQRLSAANL